ncbi:MAG: DNA polymerase III subunit beta [Erysipelotrichaceae bacterium]
MHFKIARKNLSTHLAIVSKSVAIKSPTPSLSGIKMDVKEDAIVLTSSNSEISTQSTIHMNDEETDLLVLKKGTVLIDSEYINKVVSSIDSKYIEFEVIDGSLIKINGDHAEFKINGMRSEDFPTIDFNELSKVFYLNSHTLDEIIDETAFAASEERTRPSLTGVNFKCSFSTLKCVASDSYRLAQKSVSLMDELSFNITIPASHLKKIQGIAKADQIRISLSEKNVLFVIDNHLIKINLIDDAFPDTDRLVPNEYINVLEIEASELLKIIERASFIANDKMSIIKLNANHEEVIIQSNSQEIGSYTDTLNTISFDGDPLEISFSGAYLKDALKVFRNTSCKISFSGALKPFVITSNTNETVLQLLVPVRTYI